MGEYTGLVGLAIWGLVMGTIGLIAAERERRAYRRDNGKRDSTAPAR